MAWSKLRAGIEGRFAASLRGRLRVHQARYRNTLEEMGRIWFELDGREIASFETLPALKRRVELSHELLDVNGGWGTAGAYHAADAEALRLIKLQGEQSDYVVKDDLEAFLSLSIEDALSSPNPLLKALAIADRRTGKRRLQRTEVTERAHPLIRAIFEARCLAEEISVRES